MEAVRGLTEIGVGLLAEFSSPAESDIVLLDQWILVELVYDFVGARGFGEGDEAVSQATDGRQSLVQRKPFEASVTHPSSLRWNEIFLIVP